MQDFYGDFATVLDVVGQVHGGHAAASELTNDFILTFKRRFEPREDVVDGRCLVTRIGQGELR
jgi:hypothetical protein